eukprot:GHUV01038869.1.p1 GENE.GHUV01038869.1~~GHUV01038869.1.p1  ORF type:complete len:147 (-),score=22.94 GHUV01038869.1:432-872(-)
MMMLVLLVPLLVVSKLSRLWCQLLLVKPVFTEECCTNLDTHVDTNTAAAQGPADREDQNCHPASNQLGVAANATVLQHGKIKVASVCPCNRMSGVNGSTFTHCVAKQKPHCLLLRHNPPSYIGLARSSNTNILTKVAVDVALYRRI